MTDTDNGYLNRLTQYECLQEIKRARLAYLFASRTLTQSDAADLLWMVRPLVHIAMLETMTDEDVILSLRDAYDYKETDTLWHYAQRAVDRVNDKWESNGDTCSAAIDWAVDLVEEYATEDGIELERLDPDAETAQHLYEQTG